MPAFTYLNDHDYTEPLSDSDMQELLTELRERTENDWRIGEYTYEARRLFRKPITLKYYQLYVHTNCCEFQVINPVRDIGADVFEIPTRSQIMNYMLGYLAGMDFKPRPIDGPDREGN